MNESKISKEFFFSLSGDNKSPSTMATSSTITSTETITNTKIDNESNQPLSNDHDEASSEYLNLVNEMLNPPNFKSKKPGALKIEMHELYDTPSTSDTDSIATSNYTIKAINIGFNDLSYSVKEFITRGEFNFVFFLRFLYLFI